MLLGMHECGRRLLALAFERVIVGSSVAFADLRSLCRNSVPVYAIHSNANVDVLLLLSRLHAVGYRTRSSFVSFWSAAS